jgi:DNA-dependent protein kinase catalytic subunit
MYSSQTEIEYLSYSTNLLLEKTSKSPDYNRFIYENPLSECTFREYNLTVDWRRRHEMMTPMFVDTLSSMSENSTFSSNASFSYNLRATQQQSLQFQPTQDTGAHKTPYNWLTQSNVDTFNETLTMSTLGETQSTLLFNTNKKLFKSVSGNGSAEASSDQDILKLRRRFLKDKTTNQIKFHARKQVK